ncbi:hypothetical protein BX600DRAFT_474865 [Xylariales sp. PMI_506]|nr:hypothetical protein BX600DRAFT_474865 [Xylariales sp. PMI_506]
MPNLNLAPAQSTSRNMRKPYYMMSDTTSGPGIIFSQCQTGTGVSSSAFRSQYGDAHSPNPLRTEPGSQATGWNCADSTNTYQYLTLHKVDDLSQWTKPPAVTPAEREAAGTSQLVDMDTRFYKLVEVFGKDTHSNGFPSTTHIITAGMNPSTTEASDDLDRWYREEHNEQMSKEPGWLRCSRYKLSLFTDNGDATSGINTSHHGAPEWMTIHEFGAGNGLGNKVEPVVPVSDWTRRVMGNMDYIEASVWTKDESFTTSASA